MLVSECWCSTTLSRGDKSTSERPIDSSYRCRTRQRPIDSSYRCRTRQRPVDSSDTSRTRQRVLVYTQCWGHVGGSQPPSDRSTLRTQAVLHLTATRTQPPIPGCYKTVCDWSSQVTLHLIKLCKYLTTATMHRSDNIVTWFLLTSNIINITNITHLLLTFVLLKLLYLPFPAMCTLFYLFIYYIYVCLQNVNFLANKTLLK